MNSILKNVLVFLITIVFLLILGEIYYRFINKEVLGNTGSLSYQKWQTKNVKINSWGFRDIERSQKKADPNIERVLVMGPSNIFGQGVTNLEDRLSERLQAKLNENSTKPYEVINMGTMTLDPIGTSVILINNCNQAGVEYDDVVIYYSWNAIKHIAEIGRRYVEIKREHAKPANPIDLWLSQHSYLYDWIKNVSLDKALLIEGKTYGQWHLDKYLVPEYFQRHIETLKFMDNLVKSKGAKLYLLITPISYNDKEREKYSELRPQLFSALDAAGIHYADATQIYNGIPEMEIPVSKYDAHNKSKYYGDMVNILVPVMKAQ